jgi:hypothetical protein
MYRPVQAEICFSSFLVPADVPEQARFSTSAFLFFSHFTVWAF